MWVEISSGRNSYKGVIVTPSRVCELKFILLIILSIFSCHTLTGVWVEIWGGEKIGWKRRKSHPHGCVSWNLTESVLLQRSWSHTLTGVWVEMIFRLTTAITSRSHPHGCVSWNYIRRHNIRRNFVTPSRVCELKCFSLYGYPINRCVTPSRVCELKWSANLPTTFVFCHTLTGVWVEIVSVSMPFPASMSHPHGCVSWNCRRYLTKRQSLSHTLTGVWVEIICGCAPAAVRKSHPHGCVSWNSNCNIFAISPSGHTLTGVWVEIRYKSRPLRGTVSHPHGCVSWNHTAPLCNRPLGVTPSRVCELKSHLFQDQRSCVRSHPHGCVSWNQSRIYQTTFCNSHTLTGVWVEMKSSITRAARFSHTLTGVWVEIPKIWQYIRLCVSHPHGCVSWNLWVSS